MKKIILTILIFGALSTLSFAQSSYLEKGQNGLGISGGFSTNEDITGFSGGVGYSFSGVFDLGVSISRFGFDQKLLGEDLKATVISPFVTFLPIKQDDSTPVSIGINASYQKQFYSNDALSSNDADVTGNFFTIGASIFTDIEASDGMKIQPTAGFNYITGETKIETSTTSQTESDNSTVFNLGLSLIFDSSPSNSFVVTPSLGFQEDVTTFGLSLSFVLPQN